MSILLKRLIPGAAALMLGGTLAGAAAARLTGYGLAGAGQAPVASRTLAFADTANGGVAVRDGVSGALLANIPARDDGFLRMTMRLLVAARTRQNAGGQSPFVLNEFAGGRMQLMDPATGMRVELEAFGPSNVGEFQGFLNSGARS